MSLNPSNQFTQCLTKTFGLREQSIEYVQPYNGKLGHHSAEIYNKGYNGDFNKILNKIKTLGLTCRRSSEIKETDVIVSNAGERTIYPLQIIFTNEQALKIFKEAVLKDYEEIVKEEKTVKEEKIGTIFTSSFSFSTREEKGVLSKEELIHSFPELKDLVIDTKKGLVQEIEIIMKDENSLIVAKQMIRNKIETAGDSFGGLIRQDIFDKKKLQISFKALDALIKFCKPGS